jgi:osmotically inducible protein OsmC
MAATRQAKATWSGDLMTGSGDVSGASSGKFSSLPISWAARTEQPGGKTSPEELLAAAHASCYCMALSNGLAKLGTPATRLECTATVTFDKVGDGWSVTMSDLEVKGTVPGMDAESFRKAADDAKENCPISRALKGNVQLRVRPSLAREQSLRA